MRMLEEQEKTESYLHALTVSLDKGKKSLDDAVHEMELHSQRLLTQLTQLSQDRAGQLRTYEAELRREDLAHTSLHTQLEESKRQQILAAMAAQLADTEQSDAFRRHLMDLARAQVATVVGRHRDEERRYGPLVSQAKAEQENVINHLLQDERVQEAMFRELQVKTDDVHRRIVRDMAMLENELAMLSLLEQKQQDERTRTAKCCLEDERRELAKLYGKLVAEKQEREAQLRGAAPGHGAGGGEA